MPRFSIVVPAYNAEDTLAETLDAVLAQTFDNWECIVVDDGSADSTKAIAATYAEKDPRFRVISQENQGSAGAYNTGAGAAIGDFVMLCSADDILLPAHLAEMSEFIDVQPDYDIYSTNGFFWRPEQDSRDLVYPQGTRDEVMSLSLADVIELCFYSVGAAYRRGLFERVGGYRLGVFGEDYDFWLRTMAAGARHRYLPRALSLHRVSATQKSANLERAYRSDIRLVTELRESAELSADELAAVERSVALRERLIAQLRDGQPSGGVKGAMKRGAVAVLGEDQARRLASWARAKKKPGGS